MARNWTSPHDDSERLLIGLQSRNLVVVSLESIAWIIIEIFVIVGNSITLKIILGNPVFRTVPNFLIASLAFSDIGLGIFSGPLIFGVLVSSAWPFSQMTCQFHGWITLTLACASVENLTLMAVNRYVRVVKTTKYRRYFTTRRTLLYIIGVWITSLIASTLYVPTGHKYVFHPGKFFCYLSIDDYIFLAIVVTFYIALPGIVISFCYFNVFKAIQKHNQTMSNSANISVQEIKITRTLFIIVVMFMLCWSPVFTMDMVDVVRLRWSLPREAYTAYTFLAAASSAINPLVYGIMNPSFRKEYLRVLSCGGRCKRAVVTPNGDPKKHTDLKIVSVN